MDDADWGQRLALLWTSWTNYPKRTSSPRWRARCPSCPPTTPVGLFEHGGAFDSTGHPDLAVEKYRAALPGLTGLRRRRATIQLASPPRNLGQAEDSVALLTAELDQESDELDDAVRVPGARPHQRRT
jgi:hypothetical protein